MRPLVLLLSIILSCAPFSSAMAMAAVTDSGTAAGIESPATQKTPCHTEQVADTLQCNDCAQTECSLLDCQHCANALVGLAHYLPMDVSAQATQRYAVTRQHNASIELIPESPPPIG